MVKIPRFYRSSSFWQILELTAKSRGSALADFKRDKIQRRNLAESPDSVDFFSFQTCEGTRRILGYIQLWAGDIRRWVRFILVIYDPELR